MNLAVVAFQNVMSKREVISVYREILRVGKQWIASSGKAKDTDSERQYILSQARILFKKNQTITDEALIKDHLSEAKTRLTMALHYRNPYPRPVYVPPQVLANLKGRKWQTQEKLKKQSRPVYIKSLDDQ